MTSKREGQIADALDPRSDTPPWIVAGNIGYADYPHHNNPFDPETNPMAHSGYETGFDIRRQQVNGE